MILPEASMHTEPRGIPAPSAAAAALFKQLWFIDHVRDEVLGALPKADVSSCRLVSRDWAAQAAPRLFRHLIVDFRSHTFTKPARVGALERIGQHVRTFSFSMRHGADTFLPPLLDPCTGEEVDFIYEPHCRAGRGSADRLSVPTYGSWEMTDLLVKQWPPLFHAAANVPSFIRALSAMPDLRHLQVSTPDQESAQRYRRSAVDYALMSLRIAAERAPLTKLRRLTLAGVHPAAVQHLNPTMGPGARPNSPRRWRQIRELAVHMDSTVPLACRRHADHLKLLHAYLQTFTATLERLEFRWLGAKGLFPLALGSEAGLAAASPAAACPRRCHLALRPLRFSRLVFMQVENVVTDAAQVAGFILSHRRSIAEFNFEATTLRDGTWDDALAPLTRLSGGDGWKRAPEVMDVPLILSPTDCPPKKPNLPPPPPRCLTPLIGSFDFDQVLRTSRSRGLFSVPREHMRRLLKGSLTAWRQF